MATLPDIQSLGGAVPQPAGGVAAYEPPNWRQVGMSGEIVSGAGRALQEAAQTIDATNTRQDTMVAQAAGNAAALARLNLQYSPDGFGSVKGSGVLGKQFVDKYTQQFNDQLTDIRGQLQTPLQQKLFDQHADVHRMQVQSALLQHQAEQTNAFNEQTENSTIDLARKQIFTNPNDRDAVSAGLAQMDWAINQKAHRLGWDASTLADTKVKYMHAVYDDLAELQIVQNPTQTLALINQRLGVGAPSLGSTPVDPNAPRGIRNNNPGNIEASDQVWQGQSGKDGRYAQFESPQAGIRAMTQNLLAYQDKHGLNTVAGIVGRWAPPGENDVGAYVADVAKQMGVDPDKPLNLRDSETMTALVGAMISHENGQQPYAGGVIRDGIAAGLGLSNLNPSQTPPALAGPDVRLGRPDPDKSSATGIPYIDGADVGQLLKWRASATTEMNRTMAAARIGVDQRTKDFQTMVLSGVAPPANSVPTREEYVRAFGQQGLQRYSDEVSDYVGLGVALSKLQTFSAPERAQIIASLSPIPGANFEHMQQIQQYAIRANALVQKQLDADPVAYVAQTSPKVKMAYQSMVNVINQKQDTDPETDRAGVIQYYANTVIAEQQRMGVASPRVLTNDQADGIAQQFASNSANAAQVMDGLQQQWGAAFPKVYGQLVADKKIPPVAMVIPNMSDSYSKEALARWSESGANKALKEAMPPSTAKDMEEKLRQANEPFFTSLQGQQGGTDTYAAVISAQRTLAMGYIAQGKSAGDAAALAVQQTVGHAYQFEGTLRIPTTQQPTQVLAGTRVVLRNAPLLATQIPPSFQPGLREADRHAAWTSIMQNNAQWVANDDESGVYLSVRAKNEFGADAMYAVRSPSGQPMTWTWSQLRGLGQKEGEFAPTPVFGHGVPNVHGDAGAQAIERARSR